MLLLQLVEKRRMGMRLRYETQTNMEAWLGLMKMKNIKMVRERSKFPLYNVKLKFSLRMLFNDSKQFKSAIRKYSKECRRQLKLIKNKPKKGYYFLG
ncbi:hypothetical protein Goklo_021135 [Gossypium klotzschianum]|uniref:Uncharacterized protein n=1 Tax=Gossypium klotzschianum TaxID=34286 RepID=A0A7J8UV23_9ROSI|nr:hypothetical protein [Gossypium klotzschianum]